MRVHQEIDRDDEESFSDWEFPETHLPQVSCRALPLPWMLALREPNINPDVRDEYIYKLRRRGWTIERWEL